MSDKSIAQKLLVKPGESFVLLNAPQDYAAQMGNSPSGVTLETTLSGQADTIQCFITSMQQLKDMLPGLKAALKPGGKLWLTYPKLTSKLKSDVNRDTIYTYAMTIGLQGVAMIAVDDDWAALRVKVIG
jgi:hypothetical protein